MNTDFHSLGQHEGRWYYLHISEMDYEDGHPVSSYEVFIEEDKEPVYAEVENVTSVGNWATMPANIKADINEVIYKLKQEHYHVEPDYEGYLEQRKQREKDAREDWAFRNSSR